MSTQPLVSICIPAYKAEKYLAETLQSVAKQTYENWEVIVTEDGSRDRTEELVSAFAKTVVQPVTYHRHDPNRGLPATRNHGISIAEGEWIALLDSDDLWTPDHLEKLVARAVKEDADLIHAGSLLFDSDTRRELETRAPSPAAVENFPLSLYLADYVIQPSSVFLRRALWEKVKGFNPDFRFVEDREMWLRCARAGGRFAYNGAITCLYRKHASALSAQSVPMAVASAKVYEQHVDWEQLPKRIRKRETVGAWTAAGRIVLRQQPRTAREYFGRAAKFAPFNPRVLMYRLAAAAFSLKERKAS